MAMPGGSSVNYGFRRTATKSTCRRSSRYEAGQGIGIAATGIGTVDHLLMARGLECIPSASPRIATEADVSEQHIRAARNWRWTPSAS